MDDRQQAETRRILRDVDTERVYTMFTQESLHGADTINLHGAATETTQNGANKKKFCIGLTRA